jgi:predicted metal-dependent peptidase
MKNLNLLKARNKLLIHEPFFGSLLLRLAFVEDPSHKTFWTDGRSIGFNPDLAAALPNTQVQGILAHEVMHNILLHMSRCQARIFKKWNYACDYAINPGLLKSGFELPEWVLYEKQYENMTAENIYQMLPDDYDKNEEAGAGSGEGPGQGVAGPTDELRQPPGVSPAELEQEWTIATQQALNEAKIRGKMPAHLKEFIENVLEAKISWIRQLREFMTRPRRDDYSRRRPNKRFITQGMYLPRLYSEGLGLAVIVLDTSSSTQRFREQFAAEVSAVLEETAPEKILVLSVDTRVAKVQEFTTDDLPIKLSTHGGGGTEFDPPFIWLEEHLDEIPDVFIYLTDLEGECTVNTPEYPVLWVSTTSLRDVPFGEVINI